MAPGSTSKLLQAGSKIFEKVQAFEEKRSSRDVPRGSVSGRSWASFSRTGSCESGEGESRPGLQADVVQRRSIFKKRASSLEDRPSYSQRVQNKFTEELQRIKKLVGRPSLTKAASTEQLSKTGRQSLGKVEPIPPDVVQKLQDRERVLVEREGEQPKEELSQKSQQSRQKSQTDQQDQMQSFTAQPRAKIPSVNSTSERSLGKDNSTLETGRVDLPGQCSARLLHRGLSRESQMSSLTSKPLNKAEEQSTFPLPSKQSFSMKVKVVETDQMSSSPAVRMDSPLLSEQPNQQVVQESKKPQKIVRFANPDLSPSLPKKKKKNKMAVTPPALKQSIPSITVENVPVEGVSAETNHQKTAKEGQTKNKGKGQHSRPMSPELDSSDDSYMSAEEDEGEVPRFELPLQDAVAHAGSAVVLKCIISGNPSPKVIWKRDNVEIQSSSTHLVNVEGTTHSLVIRRMRSSDSGTYRVIAINRAGRASSSATLFIKSEPAQTQRENISSLQEVSSPIISDEEYLSPVEEGVEFRQCPWRGEDQRTTENTHFREPPSFQVALRDQEVTEGQEVIMSVRVRGQPKPTINWLKNNVKMKTTGRHTVQEMKDGYCEMRITSVEKSDAGVFSCTILNEYGKTQTECRLEVKAAVAQPVLAITRPVRDVAVKAGETALFQCLMTGPQDVEVDWMSNGKLIQPALLNCKMLLDGRRCRLLLNSVHEDDSGTYTCKLSTAKEELTSSALLKVTPSIVPLFTRKLDILEVIEGRTARFDCKVSGTPPPDVTWSHFEKPVVDSENVRILREGGSHSLVIARVSSESEGFYAAVARNAHGEAECSAELYMQEPRQAISSHMAKLEKMPSIPEEPELDSEVERRTMPDFVKPLCDLEVLEGREAFFQCKVAGLPYPTIAWYHNGKKLESTEDRKMTQHRDVHSLVIRSVCHGHGGVYKSVISNKLGKATCYAHLYVADIVPNPPDGPPVVETITGKTMTLSWKRPKRLDPSIDAGSLTYAIQQQALGSIQWTIIASSLRETSYTITSLSKGVRYAFRVLAAKDKVFSKPSPATDLVQLVDKGPYLRKAPVIIDKPDVVFMVENRPVSITITLNHVHATVAWKRRGVALVNKPGMFEMSMPDDDQHTLKIIRVKSSDVGQLVCMASNQFGSDLCTVILAMAAPPTFETIMEDLDVCVGKTSRFFVVVEGKPAPHILWYKDDLLLSESSHFTFVYDDKECSLVVLNAQKEDSGVYTCTAKNLSGSISCKAELTVHAKKPEVVEPMEDEETILMKMRRLTDYYDVHKEIGRGAFSYVKRVTEKTSNVDYAAKFISARAKRRSSALREMELLSGLDHERVVYFHDAFEKKNVIVIITELCHEELLDRLTKRSTVMESEVQSCIKQLLEGLCYLHQNHVIHLDLKPENILMAHQKSEQIRICDFGNAAKLMASETQYCKYGTPEFVAPEIVNQSPVSTATDIWPVGVLTYLCLTGVSPFAGENDRSTVLNIRSYNVAFEENMFAGLYREAKGFVIKLLVADRLRPDATECLCHPWFKMMTQGKTINTVLLKQVLTRRRWQRSLISYKSKMVMRSIAELLDDSTNYISIAGPKHLKGGSSPASSSSDSDEDIDELPFIPMPLTTVFSGSRISLTEISGDDELQGISNGASEGGGLTHPVDTPEGFEPSGKEETIGGWGSGELEEMGNSGMQRKTILQRGSSEEVPAQGPGRSRRSLIRRGSSADSALLLHITPEKGAAEVLAVESGEASMKKAVSMELPRRSPSPGAGRMSQEDYALKLELMRQRLLRSGSSEKKMSGLRGPLLETLGVGNNRQTLSLDPSVRRSRVGPPPMTRSASSDDHREDKLKNKVFCKSASFSQGDSDEPISMHRQFGGPLEIPSAQTKTPQLQEATSMSALTGLESYPAFHGEISSEQPSQVTEVSKVNKEEDDEENRGKKLREIEHKGTVSLRNSTAVETPIIVIEETREEEKELVMKKAESVSQRESPLLSDSVSSAQTNLKQSVRVSSDSNQSRTGTPTLSEHPAVFSKVASNTSRPTTPLESILNTDIKDIDSEEVFEARFKKRESSLTRGLKRLTKIKSEDKSPVLPHKFDEEIYRPGGMGTPLELMSRGLQEKSKSVQDLREIDRDLGLIGRFSMRMKKTHSNKKEDKPKAEVSESLPKHRLSWRPGRSKSLDKREESAGTDRGKQSQAEQELKVNDSSVLAMRRKFESKVAGIPAKTHNGPDEKKEEKKTKSGLEVEEQREKEEKEHKTVNESPVLSMRKKFEFKVAGISARMRSHSEDRTGEEAKPEGRKTPLFPRHRYSNSEGSSLKNLGIPENQLASQTIPGNAPSKDSLESSSSANSDRTTKTPETDRKSRWDRWGLGRSKKEKNLSQPHLLSSATTMEDPQYSRLPSDFPPVFHIKLKDQVLLEGDLVTLSCLPAGSPLPKVTWTKDKKPLEKDGRINLMSCPDGRQVLTIMETTRKEAGLYECEATNPLAMATTSCTLSLACTPKRPGTPEVPQTYMNTALVLWKPADTEAPCSYTLERKAEGDADWIPIAMGVADCYYNVTDLPPGHAFQFRVACVNKAGKGPYSNCSKKVSLDSAVSCPTASAVKPLPISCALTPHLLKPVLVRPHADPELPSSASDPPAKATPSSVPSVMPGAKEVTAAPVSTSRRTEPPPKARPPPHFVLPKPQSPVNIVPPMSQASPVSTPLVLTQPPQLNKPVSSVPTYAPSTTARVAPTPVPALTFSPHVLLVSSLSPIGEGTSTPSRSTPPGHVGTNIKLGETALKQGVPQKPYTFLEEKARGRFGVIRECRENATGDMFMAKIVPFDQENKQAVLQEYEILKSLHCNKIMGLHEAYVTPRYLVLISEYCTGKELLYSLTDRFRYSEDDVVEYLVQLLQGLEYLHSRRILHLDIKPDNVMVTHLNVIKIIDLGSAQHFNPLFLKKSSRDLGTLEYMAPEFLKGDVVGPPADIWSLGILTYIMLSGKLPFLEKDPLQTETKIQAARLDPAKLYPNVSQSALAFLKKVLCSYAWARPTTKDCFNHAWLQDSYLTKLRRQTLTFTTTRLKEFLVEHHRRRAEATTKHKVLLRTYQSSPQTPPSPTAPGLLNTPESQ